MASWRLCVESIPEGDAEATALQTLPRLLDAPNVAKRLDCGAFTAAFHLHATIAENVASSPHAFGIVRGMIVRGMEAQNAFLCQSFP